MSQVNKVSQDKQHRKALIAEYKRTPKEMGVYAIRNTVNGKLYVATSRDLKARFNRHRMDLKMGSENVKPLLKDWKTLGESCFEFEVLDRLEPSDEPGYDPTEDLEVLEQIWLDKLSPWGERGYNKAPAVDL